MDEGFRVASGGAAWDHWGMVGTAGKLSNFQIGRQAA